MWLQDMPDSRGDDLARRAAALPEASPGTAYPRWYLHRWHFLPEGYLSGRSVAGYDFVIRNLYNAGQERAIIREVVRQVRRARPTRVLEVAAGPGRLLAALARARAGQEVRGVDLSPYHVRRARGRVAGTGVEVIHGDALNLGGASPGWDAVVASHYLGHLPEAVRGAAVAEIVRVMHPGASLFVVDHRWHPAPAHPALTLRDATLHASRTIRFSTYTREAAAT